MSAIDIDTAIGKLVITATGRDGSTQTLNIKTIDPASYPKNIEAPDCPIFFPDPSRWLGESSSIPKVFDTATYPQVENADTLTYAFLYAQVGEDRGLFVFYEPAALMREAIKEAIIHIDIHMTGRVSVSTTPFSMINEKVSGKDFYGCYFTVRATEEQII
jgi:hypothetical protein